MCSARRYLAGKLAKLPGVKIATIAPFFKEFPVCFKGTGKKVSDINKALLERGIYGGHDLSPDFPGAENAALYCVSETHTQADMDALVSALADILKA